MLGGVRDDVLAATGRAQQPHIYGTLGRETIALKAGAVTDDTAGKAAELARREAELARLEAELRAKTARPEPASPPPVRTEPTSPPPVGPLPGSGPSETVRGFKAHSQTMLSGNVIDSWPSVDWTICNLRCSGNARCVAFEHDTANSRCTLLSAVTSSGYNQRFNSATRSGYSLPSPAVVAPASTAGPGTAGTRAIARYPATMLFGDVIDSWPQITATSCVERCRANRHCVAAEHDTADSRCTLYALVRRSAPSRRHEAVGFDNYPIAVARPK